MSTRSLSRWEPSGEPSTQNDACSVSNCTDDSLLRSRAIRQRLIVLVVDDEPTVAQTLALLLQKHGYCGCPVLSASAALTVARAVCLDAAIVDVIMPEMDGIQLSLVLRGVAPACRILLISGHNQTTELLAKARAQGFDIPIMAKPTATEELLTWLADGPCQTREANPASYPLGSGCEN